MVKILRPGYRKRGFKHLREEVSASDRMRHIDRGFGRDPTRPPFIAGDALVGQSLAQLAQAQGEMPPEVMSLIEQSLGELSAELEQAGFRPGRLTPQRIILDMYHGAVLLRADFKKSRPARHGKQSLIHRRSRPTSPHKTSAQMSSPQEDLPDRR
jgi:hypothetical protein